MTRVALVACSKTKAAAACEAQHLYTSPLFRLARNWAIAHSDVWYIVSARHFLVAPETWLEPYDYTLPPHKDYAFQFGVHVTTRLRLAHLGKPLDISILAGARYADAIVERGQRNHAWQIHQPLRGLQIGQRLAWLQERTNP